MKYKVETTYVGIVHYNAMCQDCDWTYQNHLDRAHGQREIRKHVRDTGHTVLLEKCVSVHYEAKEPSRLTKCVPDTCPQCGAPRSWLL